MSLSNLFIRVERSIGGVQLDGVLYEDHSADVTLTQNPVEFGANITDHAIINPRKLTLRALVSDTPISITGSIGQIVDNVSGFFGTSTTENETRSTSAYNALVALMHARTQLEIQTGLLLYRDMMITNISIVRDKDSSQIANMIIGLQEVIITKSEIVQIPAESLARGKTKEQGSPTVDAGKKEPVTPSSLGSKSILKSIKDWF